MVVTGKGGAASLTLEKGAPPMISGAIHEYDPSTGTWGYCLSARRQAPKSLTFAAKVRGAVLWLSCLGECSNTFPAIRLSDDKQSFLAKVSSQTTF